MSDDEDIAALVVDNGSGMCKGKLRLILSDIAVNTKRRGRHRHNSTKAMTSEIKRDMIKSRAQSGNLFFRIVCLLTNRLRLLDLHGLSPIDYYGFAVRVS
jgi:hypothetical protein